MKKCHLKIDFHTFLKWTFFFNFMTVLAFKYVWHGSGVPLSLLVLYKVYFVSLCWMWFVFMNKLYFCSNPMAMIRLMDKWPFSWFCLLKSHKSQWCVLFFLCSLHPWMANIFVSLWYLNISVSLKAYNVLFIPSEFKHWTLIFAVLFYFFLCPDQAH